MTTLPSSTTTIRQAPIIVLNCPRPGTLLVSRLLGQCAGHLLITKHKNKAVCPEDRAGPSDNEI
jgi:hypothetical protein